MALLCALIGFVAVNVYYAPVLWGFKLFLIPSTSMSPTILPGDIVLVDLWAYQRGLVSEGDIVVFASPLNASTVLIKRVVRIQSSCDSVAEVCSSKPIAMVDVEGDNPNSSQDSRYFGMVPESAVEGKAIAVLFGFNSEHEPVWTRASML